MQIINYYYLNIKAQFYKGKNLGGQKKVERGNQQNWGGGGGHCPPKPLPPPRKTASMLYAKLLYSPCVCIIAFVHIEECLCICCYARVCARESVTVCLRELYSEAYILNYVQTRFECLALKLLSLYV